jgi:hypothetical protein
MVTLIREQGRARAELAIQDLREHQRVAANRALNHDKIWKEIYVQEGETSTDEAIALSDKLVAHFHTLEVKRLQDFASKERSKNPKDNDAMSLLLCKEFPSNRQQPSANNNNGANGRNGAQPSRPTSQERARKRTRPNSKERARQEPRNRENTNQGNPSNSRNNRDNRAPQRDQRGQPSPNRNPNNQRGQGQSRDNFRQDQRGGRGRGRGRGNLSPGARDLMNALAAIGNFWNGN